MTPDAQLEADIADLRAGFPELTYERARAIVLEAAADELGEVLGATIANRPPSIALAADTSADARVAVLDYVGRLASHHAILAACRRRVADARHRVRLAQLDAERGPIHLLDGIHRQPPGSPRQGDITALIARCGERSDEGHTPRLRSAVWPAWATCPACLETVARTTPTSAAGTHPRDA